MQNPFFMVRSSSSETTLYNGKLGLMAMPDKCMVKKDKQMKSTFFIITGIGYEFQALNLPIQQGLILNDQSQKILGFQIQKVPEVFQAG
jgi:hypothetical protein